MAEPVNTALVRSIDLPAALTAICDGMPGRLGSIHPKERRQPTPDLKEDLHALAHEHASGLSIKDAALIDRASWMHMGALEEGSDRYLAWTGLQAYARGVLKTRDAETPDDALGRIQWAVDDVDEHGSGSYDLPGILKMVERDTLALASGVFNVVGVA